MEEKGRAAVYVVLVRELYDSLLVCLRPSSFFSKGVNATTPAVSLQITKRTSSIVIDALLLSFLFFFFFQQ
jgi:hypothetical protein